MIYLKIFLAFFIPSITGFGGGASTIPLIQKEVVEHYELMTLPEYSSVLAIGNILPGPIATKLAGYIGYEVGGVLGAVIALVATIAPTTILMILLLSIIAKYKKSLRVKRLKTFIMPVIAVLMLQITVKFFRESVDAMSWMPTIIIGAAAYVALHILKINAGLVIILALIVGAVWL